jgi:hypothetical protein
MENHNYKLPTAEEMILWSAGTFPDGERKNQIAFLLQHDAFIACAMEGVEYDTQLSALPNITNVFPKRSTYKKYFIGWCLGILFGATLGVSSYYLVSSSSKSDVVEVEQKTLQNESKEKFNVPPKNPTTTLSSPSIAAQSEKPTPSHSSNANSMGDESDFIPSIAPNPLPRNHSTTLKPLIKTIVLANQKVYPYTERNAEKEGFKLEDSHTSAAFESKFDQQQNLTNTKQIAYLDFLTDALLEFNQQNWKVSSEIMDLILAVYPEDVNALYFKAQICFFQGNSSVALEYFEKILQHPIHVFEKEAKEFKRRCL